MRSTRPHPLCILMLLWIVPLVGCHRNPPIVEVEPDPTVSYKENMINANKYIEQSEKTQITSYVSRRHWDMKRLDNGAWLEVTTTGKGAPIDWDDTVTVSYRLSALDGQVFYPQAHEVFVVGRHQTTVGLDRAVLGMQQGSQARLIVPSNLGYGVAGDGDRVPGRAVLVYELSIDQHQPQHLSSN